MGASSNFICWNCRSETSKFYFRLEDGPTLKLVITLTVSLRPRWYFSRRTLWLCHLCICSGDFRFQHCSFDRRLQFRWHVRLCILHCFPPLNLFHSDIDFKYPSNSAQGQGLADLMTALRTAFDNLASRKGDSTPYLITAAVAAGAANYANLKVPQMNSAMNFWNLMVSVPNSIFLGLLNSFISTGIWLCWVLVDICW